MAPSRHYQEGGTVSWNALYVERAADRALLDQLLDKRRLCSVLAPRQVGKSSLRLRIAQRLRDAGRRVAEIDLAKLGTQGVTQDDWYVSLAGEVVARLDLDIDAAALWASHAAETHPLRWARLLATVAERCAPDEIVIFLDEIDTVLRLPGWADAFVTSLRAHYNEQQAQSAARPRVTFCLLGFAAPGELFQNPQEAAFNVDERIAVDDFTFEEAQALLPGLAGYGAAAQAVLDAVFAWTEGHPYMTCRLCAEMVRRTDAVDRTGPVQGIVDDVVNQIFLLRGERSDANLSTASDYLDHGSPRMSADRMVALYRRLLEAEGGIRSEPGDAIETHLRLSGAAAVRVDAEGHRRLRVRNRVFREVLDLDWIAQRQGAFHLSEQIERRRRSSTEERENIVLVGEELEQLEAKQRERSVLVAPEQEILTASLAKARDEARLSATRARRAVWGLTAAAIMLALLAAALYWQVQETRRSRENERQAKDKALLAVRAERGGRADVLAKEEDHEVDALAAAIQGAVGDGATLETAPPAAIQGLASAALRGRRLLRVPGERPMFSHDRSRLLTLGPQAEARLWDAREGTLIANLEGHPGPVAGAIFSPDSTRLVTSCASLDNKRGELRLWDAASGKLLSRHDEHTGAISQITFSPDSARWISSSADQTARVWSSNNGAPVAKLAGLGCQVLSADLSADGRRALTRLCHRSAPGVDGGLEGGRAQLWAVPEGTLLGTFPAVNAIFSPDGAVVTAAGDTREIKLWDADGKARGVLRGAPTGIEQLWISPDGEHLLSKGHDGQQPGALQRWDLRAGRSMEVNGVEAAFLGSSKLLVDTLDELRNLPLSDDAAGCKVPEDTSHTTHDATRRWAVSRDGSRLITAVQGRTQTWDGCRPVSRISYRASLDALSDDWTRECLASGGITRVTRLEPDPWVPTVDGPPFGPTEVRFSASGARVVMLGEYDSRASIWDARSGELIRKNLSTPRGNRFSSETSRLAVLANDRHELQLWDPESDAPARTLKHDARVRSANFSTDGARLVTTSDDGTVRVWDTLRGDLTTVIDKEKVNDAELSRDGARLLLIGTQGGGLHLVDTATQRDLPLEGSCRDTSRAHFSPDGRLVSCEGRWWRAADGSPAPVTGYSLTASPDGSRLVQANVPSQTADGGRTTLLLDASSGATIAELPVRGFEPYAAFSPDGSAFVVRDRNGLFRVYSAKDGTLRAEQKEHRDEITRVAFSPDGSTMATMSDDRSVILWTTSDFTPLAILPLSTSPTGGEISPDGRRIAVLGDDDKARIYPITSRGFLHLACQRLRRFPTDYEPLAAACAPYVDREP